MHVHPYVCVFHISTSCHVIYRMIHCHDFLCVISIYPSLSPIAQLSDNHLTGEFSKYTRLILVQALKFGERAYCFKVMPYFLKQNVTSIHCEANICVDVLCVMQTLTFILTNGIPKTSLYVTIIAGFVYL